MLEHQKREADWKNWGPYLSERAWGTVREDYSQHGNAWDHFPHDHARSRVYRWNEDGLAGICDRHQHLCFALALWNEHDPILKERLFGLSGPEGNHGEDVKEAYFYLDSSPTHFYMKMLYKYPFAFPYANLIVENGQRGWDDDEFELTDTSAFAGNRYFDVFIEYAKVDANDILIQLTVHNRSEIPKTCHILPTLWFRNSWSWGYEAGPMGDVPAKPRLHLANPQTITANHATAGVYCLYAQSPSPALFTENETNFYRFYGAKNPAPYVKDAFHRHIINREQGVINPEKEGTKGAFWEKEEISAGDSCQFRYRLCKQPDDKPLKKPFARFEAIFAQRIAETEGFYAEVQPSHLTDEEKAIQRQAYAGMLWSKQLYYYDIPQWLDGDPGQPPPPAQRQQGRNSDWRHLTNFDIISMPDKWEYPWYAAWDLAFHCLPLTHLDPQFAKRQLTLMTREWYIHPNGQLPAYEWSFSDVNPPVHAWGAYQIYQIDAQQTGVPDLSFLEAIFHKCLLNFTWWVNRKDYDGDNIFQGGFLGLDNIGVFDRSAQLPTGGHIDQADGTAWMGFYCLTMLEICLELAKNDPVYEDLATKFFEHFLRIAHAMSNVSRHDISLWDEEDGFYYDALHLPNGEVVPLKVRSLVGLTPLFAALTLEPGTLSALPAFQRRMNWFLDNRPGLSGNMESGLTHGAEKRRLMAILTRERLERVLERMLDEAEFLSPFGVRSLSKVHQKEPFGINLNGSWHEVRYEPGESRSGLFGGNSNWRGPIWLPMNYLIIEALRKNHRYYGDSLQVACPTGSENLMTLGQVADEISRRLTLLFKRDEGGNRPIDAGNPLFRDDPHWRDLLLFYEYFHGDAGKGLGASHQTGWTGLIANLLG